MTTITEARHLIKSITEQSKDATGADRRSSADISLMTAKATLTSIASLTVTA